LSRETTAEDIDAWDSLTHVQLVVAIEERFRIRLTTGEIVSLANVGQLLDLIEARVR
jgi:acyl carrier protein